MAITNRMHLVLNIYDIDSEKNWSPGIRLINDSRYGLSNLSDTEREVYISEFAKFMASELSKLLRKNIRNQRYLSKWKSLSPSYLEYKKRTGLSDDIWIATGRLVKSITYYKAGNSYVVGIPSNKMYPKSNVSVLFVAKCMEFGTRNMPPRPLFGPTIMFMRRNIRKYWEKFLSTKREVLNKCCINMIKHLRISLKEYLVELYTIHLIRYMNLT